MLRKLTRIKRKLLSDIYVTFTDIYVQNHRLRGLRWFLNYVFILIFF